MVSRSTAVAEAFYAAAEGIAGQEEANMADGDKVTARLCTDGEEQVVYLPIGFRFDGVEVAISKIGNKVMLEPIERPGFDADAWRARLDALGARDFLTEGEPTEAPPTV